MFPRGKNVVLGLSVASHPKSPSVFGPQKWASSYNTTRTLRTGIPLMTKLLTVDEIFARRSLQDHLKKLENDYGECLKLVNSNNMTEQGGEEELRLKRTKVSRLVPLIQCIKALETKQKEMAETEILLKGETTEPQPQAC